jgi:hypothetical protein
MEHLVFAIGAGTIVPLGTGAYYLFERWNRGRRLRGAQECLDAVHNRLARLAEMQIQRVRELKNYTVLNGPPKPGPHFSLRLASISPSERCTLVATNCQ